MCQRDIIDDQYNTLTQNIMRASEKAMGKGRTNTNKKRKTPFYTPEIKEITNQTKETHIKYLRNRHKFRVPREFLKKHGI